MKLVVLRNRLRQAASESPLKVAVGVVFLGAIWFGLYALFNLIFESFDKTPLEGAVVVPVIFNFFFLALLILLGFSNAVIVYGSLFAREEPEFLLAAPVRPTQLVLIKYFESLFFASWALILLGLPLMMAMARSFEEDTAFYLLFLAFFLFFVPIPGGLGLILAWLAARFSPGRGERALILAGAVVLLAAALWSLRVARSVELVPERWASEFFSRMDFVQAILLPSTWVSRGIEQVLRQRHGLALGYLAVTLANALFVSWVAVQVCGRGFLSTYNRAMAGASSRTSGRQGSDRRANICELPFIYLPTQLRLIAAKDLRTFLRDPMQWSQLAVLFGLMVLYLLNMPRFYRDFADTSWGLLLPFLNLCAVTLMLATFTTRFVFPLVSLEGRQLWMLNLLPLSRGRIMLAKLAYAATVTSPLAIATPLLAARSLDLNWSWSLVHVTASLAACLSLCGLAVGIGARLPLFAERNPGRIANGFGGTVNLVASVSVVLVILAGMALASERVRRLDLNTPDRTVLLFVGGSCLIALGVGLLALCLGARHLSRVEV
jgi:ABC-2 type transport system permease protein